MPRQESILETVDRCFTCAHFFLSLIHIYHEIAAKQFHGGFGAIITLRTESKERAFQILNELKIPWLVSNIGDTKTLVIHPSSTIAAHLSQEEKELSGVYDDMRCV